jgi:hypothetical protein
VALAIVLTQIEFPAHYLDVVDRRPLALALVCLRDAALVGVVALASRALQPGRKQDLLHARGAPVTVGLD